MLKCLLIALCCCCFLRGTTSSQQYSWTIERGTDRHPYVVSVRKQGVHKCSGSIISRNYVLTAASGLGGNLKRFSYNPALYTVHAGSTDRVVGSFYVEVENINVHERFSKDPIQFNIALVELSQPLPFSQRIQPIGLANVELPHPSFVLIYGWGLPKTDGEVARDLQVLPWRTKRCMKSTSLALCMDYNTRFCNADVGGPVIAAADDAQLVGVATFFNKRCEDSTAPEYFTNVYSHLDWIRNNTDL